MRHRDPRLFYLTMEITIKRSGARTCLVLDDDTRPILLQACYPNGDSKFCLQTKPGGLIRVHTTVLNPTSQYKSLLVSEETTSDELLGLLLSCYNSMEPVEQFSLYEVCSLQEYQRKLHADDRPLITQMKRKQKGENCHFLVRRNPILSNSSRLLIGFNDKPNLISNRHSLAASFSLQTDIINSLTKDTNSSNISSDQHIVNKNNNNNINNVDCKNIDTSLSSLSKTDDYYTNSKTNTAEPMKIKCNHKTSVSSLRDLSLVFKMPTVRQKSMADNKSFSAILSKPSQSSYSPVYNVRDIMTQQSNKRNVISEPVNTNPIKGVGNFVYI